MFSDVVYDWGHLRIMCGCVRTYTVRIACEREQMVREQMDDRYTKTCFALTGKEVVVDLLSSVGGEGGGGRFIRSKRSQRGGLCARQRRRT